jgi:tryptophanyl-tRNA synthetase
MKKRSFSGIQPTGSLHVGNYLGVIRHWVDFQNRFQSLFCIVDLHALTVHQNPPVLRSKIREVAALLLAAGIDPAKATLFVQSNVGAHSELAWILNCVIPMGWMERMTQFREKSDRHKERVSVGLFDYPALMAADILLYDTDVVPVGEDQRQHVELTRDTAKRFNGMYGDTFKMPEALIAPKGARLMGLDDPTRKMSKSETGAGHTICLLDSPDLVRQKVMRATTDSLREIRFDEGRPGIHNLLVIYELLTGLDRPAIESRFEGKGYAELKREITEVITESLAPIQGRFRDLMTDVGYLETLLVGGAEKARQRAYRTLQRVKERIGIAG